MSVTIHDLRQNLAATRDQYGRRSSRTAEAFQALVRGAAEAGAPLDGLRHHVADETERFFSYTIPGPDGHVYWDGPRDFVRNDGRSRVPLRWWWQHKGWDLENGDDLVRKCGEKNCINPEHAAKERVRGYTLRFTDRQILGALQVEAGRLGHSPTSSEWEKSKREPSNSAISSRFGSWANAISAAGLEPCRSAFHKVTKTHCLNGIRHARKVLGHWPAWDEYARVADELRTAGFPTTIHSAVRLYGSWPKARQAAGDPSPLRAPAHMIGFDQDTVECDKGHLLEGDNLKVLTSGRYQCITCRRERWRENKRRGRTAVGSPVDSTSRESGASQREDQ